MEGTPGLKYCRVDEAMDGRCVGLTGKTEEMDWNTGAWNQTDREQTGFKWRA